MNKAVLAQPVERMAFNHVVVGSIPTDGARPFLKLKKKMMTLYIGRIMLYTWV